MTDKEDPRIVEGHARSEKVAKFFGWTCVGFGYSMEGADFCDGSKDRRGDEARFHVSGNVMDALLRWIDQQPPEAR
jgi:hypothetical protein